MFLQTPIEAVSSPEIEKQLTDHSIKSQINPDENCFQRRNTSLSTATDSRVSVSSTYITESEYCDTDGYDTDLENGWESEKKKKKHGNHVIEDYIKECNRHGAIPVSYFQRHIHDRKFIMKYYGLGPLGAKAIAKPLEVNTKIEVLDLEGNSISCEGVIYLGRSLKENVAITVLDLSDNELGSKGAKAISEAMKDNQLIQELYLSRNNFRDTDGEPFYTLLVENNKLQKLVLQHNQFEFAAVKWLKKALQENITLQTLDLSWNSIHLQGARHIAEMIKDNYGLKCLDLKMNGLGTTGAAALGAALKFNHTLTDLNMEANRINNQGIMQFAKGLVSNEVLEILELGRNPIDQQGAFALICAIGNNKHSKLKLLDLSNIRVNDDFEKVLFTINDQNEESQLRVVHAGLHRDQYNITFSDEDPRDTFERDPMTKLKRYTQRKKLRLVDLFRQFDKEQNWSISLEQFQAGIKSTGIQLTEKEIKQLMLMLGQDKDGRVYYREFLYGDKSNRSELRQILKEANDDKIRQEELRQRNIIKEFDFNEKK